MRNPFDATGTIGKLPCERSLNKILADRGDARLIKKVTKLLQLARFRLKQLKHIPDPATYWHFRVLHKRDMERGIEAITGSKVRGLPVTDVVASHMMCCLHAYFNFDPEYLKENDDALGG